MNFGFYCNWKLVLHEEKYFISSLHFKYIKVVSEKFNNIYLLTTVRYGCPSVHDIEVDIKNIKIIPLPFFEKYQEALPFFFIISYRLKLLMKDVDFLFIRYPEPFSWVAAIFKKDTIINYHYASNPLEAILASSSNKLSGYLKYFIFYPEYILLSIASFLNKCSANGSSVIDNVPFYLKKRMKVLYESSLNENTVTGKKYRKILLNETINFLCVSRMQHGKGLPQLIDAFSMLKNRCNVCKWHLTIVGDGILLDQLKKQAIFLNIKRYIDFTGFVKHGPTLDKIYSKHDVFIMPSLSESGPRVLIEAMAESLFCISTNVGYAPEVLNSGKAGKLISPGNIEEIFEACIWIHKNRNFASEMAKSGFEKSKKFSIESFFEKMLFHFNV